MCRASHIDLRILDLYGAGVTIRPDLTSLGEHATVGQPATQGPLGAAVPTLLRAPVQTVPAAG